MKWDEVFPTHPPTHEQTFDLDAPFDASTENTLLPAPTHPPTHADAWPPVIPTHRPPLGGDAATAHQTTNPPFNTPLPTAIQAADWPTRCAYCGSSNNPRVCCPRHSTTPMCDWCRSTPRRPDDHRTPLEAAPGPTAICHLCRLEIPYAHSWPSNGPGLRVCVPCLTADNETRLKAEQ